MRRDLIVDDNREMAENLAEIPRDRDALVDLRVPGGPDGEAMRRLGDKVPGLPMLIMTGVHPGPAAPGPGLFRKPFATAAVLAAVERLHAPQSGPAA